MIQRKITKMFKFYTGWNLLLNVSQWRQIVDSYNDFDHETFIKLYVSCSWPHVQQVIYKVKTGT